MTAEKLLVLIATRGLYVSVEDGRIKVSGPNVGCPLSGLSRSLQKAIWAVEPELVRIINEQEVAAASQEEETSREPEGVPESSLHGGAGS